MAPCCLSLLKGDRDEGFSHATDLQHIRFRSNIVDRNGEILATSLRTFSLYANARVV